MPNQDATNAQAESLLRASLTKDAEDWQNRKKLAKRYGVFHYRDLDRVSVWRMYNVWPKALRWGYGVDLAAADQVT